MRSCFAAQLSLASIIIPLSLVLTSPLAAQGPADQDGAAVLPVVADTCIACYPIGERGVKGTEQANNAGAAEKLKLKRFENRPIMRFDFSAVPANATITEADLQISVVNDRPINFISVGTLHVPWNEGDGAGKDEPDNTNHTGACFLGPKGPESRWLDYEEGDFNAVTDGNGGDATSVAKAKSLGNGRWSIPIDPMVIHAARADGQTLVLVDDTGIFSGEMTNAYIASSKNKDKNARPTLRVKWAAQRDTTPPRFKDKPSVVAGPMAGSLLLHLPPAGDDGLDGCALGYRVSIDGVNVPITRLPRPNRVLRTVLLRDLPAGKTVKLMVSAYDKGGNTCSEELTATITPAFAGTLAPAPAAQGPVPQHVDARGFTSRLTDGMTLIDPVSGKVGPKQKRSQANDGAPAERSVVAAVRGEFVDLQCIVQLPRGTDKLDGLTISATDLASNGPVKIPASSFEFFREVYVKMGNNWVADILPAITDKTTLSIPSQEEITGQRALAIYIDLLVDKSIPPGTYTGEIILRTPQEKATLPLTVFVDDITLPDQLSFLVALEAYGHGDNVDVFHETYRLLHKHRMNYNVLGYGHTNTGSLTTPKLNRDTQPDIAAKDLKITDWSRYDQFYGPLFSGDIAKDLPRKGVPAVHWYLPFHDAWPWPLSEGHPELYKNRPTPGDKAAFEAWCNKLATHDLTAGEYFNDNWRSANAVIGAQFREHFRQNGWNRTRMLLFDNHKYYFPSGSASLWTMDEPQYGRDYHALDTILSTEKKVVAGEGINVAMRADVSRPELMGDRMDDASELFVVSSALGRYPRLMEDRQITGPSILWWYGGGDDADADPCSTPALFQERWSQGCDGGMPVYTSFGGTNEWNATDRLRIVRFDPKTGMPVASFRMKAYRHGQQEMELLNLLAAKPGYSRWHLRDLLSKEIPVKLVTISKGPDDPGYSTFQGLDVARLDLMRARVVASLLAK